MSLKRTFRIAIAGVLCLGLGTLPCPALVTLNDGRDKVFVTGTTSVAWDSNIFARQDGGGDSVMSAGLIADYTRRAGLIGVDASAAINASNFSKFSSENFQNPSLTIEFTKQSGRTTGSLAFSAARENRADYAANIRDQSWYYTAALNLKYPVIQRYSLSGGVAYSSRKFQDTTSLVNLTSYSANLDIFYVYTSERDLFGGYRYRQEQTSAHSTFTDHAFTLGISGKILPKLNGTVRGGYQIRDTRGRETDQFTSWTSTAALTWNLSKRTTITGELSKDFSTTSTNATTDTLAANLSAQYNYSAKISASTGVSAGQNHFLGTISDGRKDRYFTYTIGLNYSLNDHFRASLNDSFTRNWSTLQYAEFTRNAITLNLTSRW
jgi:hypothetical protein